MQNSPEEKNELQKQKKEITKSELEFFLVQQKKTLREVGKIFGVSHFRIFQLANFFGVERKKQIHKNRHEEIFELYLDGVHPREIARRLGVTVRTIYRICSSGDPSSSVPGDPVEVEPYRCPVHGIVKFQPCIACLAEKESGH